jgi:Sec-independent protein translocase protein TatA
MRDSGSFNTGTMGKTRDTKKEAKSVRGRIGRRRIFGGSVAWLMVGALIIIVLVTRRQEAAGTIKAAYSRVRERLGQVREQSTRYDTDSAFELVNNNSWTRTESARHEASFQKEELVERAQQITRGPARESQEEEATDIASETEQKVRQYLKNVQYPASKDDLVSAARSNDAPEELIERLVGLSIKEYSDPAEVAVAVDSRRSSGG